MKTILKAVPFLFLCISPLKAATFNAESGSFTTSFTAFSDSATSQSLYFSDNGVVTLTVTPFSASLGTLVKVSVNWDIGGAFSGTAGGSGGSASISFGGSFRVDSNSYSGAGGGNGGSGAANAPFAFTMTDPISSDYEFLAGNAGVTYNPAIWAAFTGANPFTVSMNAGTNAFASYTGVASGTLSTFRNVAVIYTYNPVPDASKWGVAQGLLACAALWWFRRRAGV